MENDLEFTGERWIPGKTDRRVEDDHVQRYAFACRFSRGKRVLDIACGAGAGSHMLATSGGALAVMGVDIDAETIDYARSRYPADNLEFELGDICAFEGERSHDLVVCFETIEHVIDDRKALLGLRRCLRPGGQLLISSPNRPITSPACASIDERPTNEYHVREYTRTELEGRLREAGFSMTKAYGQRLRLHVGLPIVDRGLQKARRVCGMDPDSQTSPTVVPFVLRKPRYLLIVAVAN